MCRYREASKMEIVRFTNAAYPTYLEEFWEQTAASAFIDGIENE